MKKMTCFVMALALVLGLAQCKKETVESQVEKVRITLNVDGGASTGSATNGSRAEVNPPQVNFVNNDEIVVAYDGKYVGTLTHNGSYFEGDIEITPAEESQPLYFYFLGNNQGTIANGATGCTANISDQTNTNNKPVISMGKSTDDYDVNVASYSSRLYNKASLMKFNVDTPSDAAICITGMNNLVTVDFGKHGENGDGLGNGTNNGFSYSMDTQDGGLITMPAKDENNVTWAIVLPQDALVEGAEGSAYTADNAYIGIRPTMKAIAMNTFLSEGKALTLTTAAVTVPEGAINGLFSVSATKQVWFSKGNLQATGTTSSTSNSGWTWSFAENQYDIIGNAIANTKISGNGRISSEGTVDLFGWSTSSTCFGINNSTNNNDYNGDFFDWSNNTIQGASGTWRTLSSAEWSYLFTVRAGAANKYGYATVNNVYGIILLPDDFTDPMTNNGSGAFVGSSSTGWSLNTYSGDNWTAMENAGAVFLPAAGSRNKASVYYGGEEGYYWSSTSNGETSASYMDFARTYLRPERSNNRYSGRSVRLVHE